MSEIIEALERLNAEDKEWAWYIYPILGEVRLCKANCTKGSSLEEEVVKRGTEAEVMAHILSLLPPEERVEKEGPAVLPQMTPEEVAACKAAQGRGAVIQFKHRDIADVAQEWKDCVPIWSTNDCVYRVKPGTDPGEKPAASTEPRQWWLCVNKGEVWPAVLHQHEKGARDCCPHNPEREALRVIPAAPALAQIAELKQLNKAQAVKITAYQSEAERLVRDKAEQRERAGAAEQRVKELEDDRGDQETVAKYLVQENTK